MHQYALWRPLRSCAEILNLNLPCGKSMGNNKLLPETVYAKCYVKGCIFSICTSFLGNKKQDKTSHIAISHVYALTNNWLILKKAKLA